ncbi:guanine nucleotide binding protein, alpha subunit [Infundibulicybe gibba]|nr:guanine nucleotide binding protein, alpha subunit [Infundibulicybe gibba]
MIMPVPTKNKQSDDPLDAVLRPPPDETPEQAQVRLEREEEARRVSAEIDASIKAERQARRKKQIVRLLLLGQSESGKSTTLRQFQRLYTPTAFREERILWRAVIQLNIVRSIRTILDALSPLSHSHTSPHSSPRTRARSISRPQPYMADFERDREAEYPPHITIPDEDALSLALSPLAQHQHPHSHRTHAHSPSSPYSPSPEPHDPEFDYDSDHQHTNPSSFTHYSSSTPFDALKTRLLPLLHIEALLIAKLVPPNEEEAGWLPGRGGHTHNTHSAEGGYIGRTSGSYGGPGDRAHSQEIFVRPGREWKGALARARVHQNNGSEDDASSNSNSNSALSNSQLASTTSYVTSTMSNDTRTVSPPPNQELLQDDEPQQVLHACRRDMMVLWNDDGVREILRKRKVKLEEGPGFFLNDLDRVTSLKYMPTDDDVLKARLKTVGVSEYKFEMEVAAGRDSGTEWRIVDVGGSRSQRPTWAPFFDDVDAIIFLAPISGFDQVLQEDKTVNRLEDSVLLWKAVCSNKLLANVDLVLFLNKCDILERKLKGGVRLSKYVRSYGDRENDLDTVSKYLRGKFRPSTGNIRPVRENSMPSALL